MRASTALCGLICLSVGTFLPGERKMMAKRLWLMSCRTNEVRTFKRKEFVFNLPVPGFPGFTMDKVRILFRKTNPGDPKKSE